MVVMLPGSCACMNEAQDSGGDPCCKVGKSVHILGWDYSRLN